MTTTNTAFKTPGALQRGPGTISLLALYQKRPPSGASHRGSVFSFFHSTGILSHRAPSPLRSPVVVVVSSLEPAVSSSHLNSTQLHFFLYMPHAKTLCCCLPLHPVPSHASFAAVILFIRGVPQGSPPSHLIAKRRTDSVRSASHPVSLLHPRCPSTHTAVQAGRASTAPSHHPLPPPTENEPKNVIRIAYSPHHTHTTIYIRTYVTVYT